MRFKCGILFLLILLKTLFAFAGIPTYVFHQLTIKDGLSEGTVRAITEDAQGYMWFGTEDGLNKYDGYKFSVFRYDPNDRYSVSSNNIKCFLKDKNGLLWIGTRHGVNIYDHKLNRFYNRNSDYYQCLKNLEGDVERIISDDGGNVWVATSSHGLFKVTSLHQTAEQFVFPEKGNVSMFLDIDYVGPDKIYVATNDGLLYFNTKKKAFTDLRPVYGNGYQVRDLYIGSDKTLWLATVQGFKKISPQGIVKDFEYDHSDKNSISGNNVVRILAEKDKLLLAVDGYGIELFDPQDEKFYHYNKENGTQLNSNNITAFFKDSKGNFWAGTFLNGINFSNVATNFFVSVKNNSSPNQSVKSGVVTSFLKDTSGDFWISTDGGGLYLKKKGDNSFVNFNAGDKKPLIGSNAALFITEDQRKNIWIATYAGGVTRIAPDGKSKIFKHHQGDPFSLGFNKTKAICEHQDRIWISTYGMGASVYDPKTDRFKQYRFNEKDNRSVPSDWVYWFLNDSRGTLWLGTFNGLSQYVPEKDNFITYKFDTKGSSADRNYIFDIYEDRDRNLWLGTNGGGLVLFDRETKMFTAYTVESGLSDNVVRTILQDNHGDLWLGTNNGITQFSVATRKAVSYKINDGLPAGSFFFNSKYKDEQGKICFGMNDGYLIIDPSLANESVEYPSVVLTELSIFNVPVVPGTPDSPLKEYISEAERIDLPYDRNSISLEFAALNFSTPKHNYYAYKLEGFDRDWNYAGKNRIAKYTNLDPGTYVFKVKASNNQKSWGTETKDFIIYIDTPFWATFWFKAVMVLALAVSVLAVFYLRTKSIRERNKWLTEQVEAQTSQLKEVNKMLEDEKNHVLQQQKLLLDKKNELEKSNERLIEWSQFQNKLIGIIGHDIRGPLQNFSLLLQLQDEKSAEWVQAKLKETASSLSLLATDLLSWVSLQSQKGEVELTEFTWMQIIEKAKTQLAPVWKPKELNFVIKDNEECMIKGAPPMALACLRNIMSNSIRYSPQGGVIEIETGIRENGFAGLRITDFGQGFDAERVNKIIQGEAFTGVKDTNLKESAGLGLAICYDMIKRTGGWTQAASLPGSGATFFIYLPCVPKKIIQLLDNC